MAFKPSLKLKEALRDRAVAFNALQVLTADALLTTQARLDNLGMFSNYRVELSPADSGNYDATLHLAERNGWGDSKAEGIVSLLSGLPYATIYPQFYNLGRDAVNLTSLARWDSEKRRFSLAISMPLYGNPSLRLRFYADARNENWNLTRTFLGAATPLTDLNMRRAAAGVQREPAGDRGGRQELPDRHLHRLGHTHRRPRGEDGDGRRARLQQPLAQLRPPGLHVRPVDRLELRLRRLGGS